MKKGVIILLFLFTSLLAFSQKTDLHAIRKELSVEDIFLQLKVRFLENDTSLTKEEHILLYYGHLFYPPKNFASIVTSENKIRQLNFLREYDQAIALSDSLLEYYPISLQVLFEKSFAYSMLDLSFEEHIYQRKYRRLIKALLSGNDGLSIEDPIIVLSQTDEYEILRYLDLNVKNSFEVIKDNRKYDVFDLKSNKRKIKTIYFDISAYTK